MIRSGVRRAMQITIRGIEPELEQILRRLSRDEGISLNKAALRLLARGANLNRPRADPQTIGQDLDHLFGTWTRKEAEDFQRSIQSCEQVDEDFWK